METTPRAMVEDVWTYIRGLEANQRQYSNEFKKMEKRLSQKVEYLEKDLFG